jgi:dTDP-4-amino-4,6-dideoxygalactose transaminase
MRSSHKIELMIPSVPSLNKIAKYFERIDQSKIYSNFGPLNSELIGRLALYFGLPASNIVTVANATLGIQGALETSPTQPSSSWDLPSWTFTATAAAAVSSTRAITFRDVNNEGRLIASTHADAVIDVLPFGAAPRFERLPSHLSSAIIDAAASFDSLKDLSFDRDTPFSAVISLHATKILPAGEGGVFVTNSEEWASKFKAWTNFGMGSNRISNFVGTNAKLSEYAAAVALSSLDEWPQLRPQLLELSERAFELSTRFSLKTTEAMKDGLATPYWVIFCKNHKVKSDMVGAFQEANIMTRDWWGQGCHKMPAYAHVPFDDLSTTDQLAATSLGLPFHLQLTNEDFTRIEKVFAEVLG